MDRDTLRHMLATFAYRTRQIVRRVPAGYPDFDAGYGVRTPLKILGHMSGVIAYAVHCFSGEPWGRLESLSWDDELRRLESGLEQLDGFLENGEEPQSMTLSAILQGPLSDCMTHVGQLATLRRMAGQAVPGENFMKAPIVVGELKLT